MLREAELGWALFIIVVASAWLALVSPQLHSTEPDATAAKTSHAPPVAAQANAPADKCGVSPQSAPGLKIYIDPKTGEISKPPPSSAPAQTQQRSFESAKEAPTELRETPSPRPGGGMMIDLKDRFRNPLIATRDADGKLSIRHRSDTSGSSEKK